jgi:ADP-dependent NAD(P)H-hydrate dehydratase / NAD(P)H-hydrate epimerase
MERTYWHKQASDKPLFPDVLWSRPENRAHAGKLFIAGGSSQTFAAPAEAFAEAGEAGIGTARVLLPDSLQKTVGRVFEAGEYAPSTPSGSFSQQALSEFVDLATWADATLLADSFGKNSETAILLEKFIDSYAGQLILAGDSIDYFLVNPALVLEREAMTLVPDFTQLQKLAMTAKFPTAFTSNMDFLHRIDALHEFSLSFKANIVLPYEKSVFVAVQGQVSTTQFEILPDATKLAAHAATWWLQNPSKPFEALTTAIFELK